MFWAHQRADSIHGMGKGVAGLKAIQKVAASCNDTEDLDAG